VCNVDQKQVTTAQSAEVCECERAETRLDIIGNVITRSNVFISSKQCLSALAVAHGPSMFRDCFAFLAKGCNAENVETLRFA
jgi:hypothetical protein